MASYDILVAAEPRFSGGSASALIADVQAFVAMGARIALLPVTSGFFAGSDDRINQTVMALADHDQVDLIAGTGPIDTDLAFFHHPLTFYHGVAERQQIRAKRALLVAHHPPFRGDGSLEYNPLRANANMRRAFGLTPWWAPVSGLVRRQLRSFAPLVCQSTQNWVNVFDPDLWVATRPAFAGDAAPTVGRHGRADFLKWPERAQDVLTPLSPGPDWRVRVMGYPNEAMRALGVAPTDWDILSFNQEPVDRFLESLDVFCYFHHAAWQEAFGRTIVEAMLMERPCVLDPRLRPTFGDLAQYCPPDQAPALLNALRADPGPARARAAETRAQVCREYASAAIPDRVRALQFDTGDRSRKGSVSAPALVTLRKVIGLARREAKTV